MSKKLDMGALDDITRQVLAYKPAKDRKPLRPQAQRDAQRLKERQARRAETSRRSAARK